MRFAHLADCHIGSWRDPKLRDASLRVFEIAVNKCISENVDFVLLAGDIFNTSLPSIDHLNIVVKKLKDLKDNSIKVYAIEGSHDFSPSGKTIIKVLENAGLLINTAKEGFTFNEKTGVKICGVAGKKGGLETELYKKLNLSELEKEKGFKIFMFHSAIKELRPAYLEEMQAVTLASFPKNFSYYAGGHVHIADKKDFSEYPNIVFPGPLFPNSFSELEQLKVGGFYIYDNNSLRYERIQIYPVFSMKIDCNDKNAEEIPDLIHEEIKNKEFIDTIVTIRLYGCLKTGKPSDIDFNSIFSVIYDKSAYFVMRNTYKLASKEFEYSQNEISSVEDAEDAVIKEHIGKSEVFEPKTEKQILHRLLEALNVEKEEGQTNTIFEETFKENADKIFDELTG